MSHALVTLPDPVLLTCFSTKECLCLIPLPGVVCVETSVTPSPSPCSTSLPAIAPIASARRGAGASHNAAIATSAVTFTSGKPKVFADTAQSGNTLYRHFCGDCGSPIYSQREKSPGMMTLKVGTLDESDDAKLVMNIWTSSARPWMPIDPTTEQYPENRPVKS